MDFADLPGSPDDLRYLKRIKAVDNLLKAKQDRLVEEGMLMDRFTAEDDFYWFLLRFTSFADPNLRSPGAARQGFRITERGHPLRGKLWIEHPFMFWYARELQRIIAEPPDGPVWVCMHRIAYKSTLMQLFIPWLHTRNELETCALWTHSVDKIGSNMGRVVLDLAQGAVLVAHWPQFDMREAKNLGYMLDRPPGPRDQSFSVYSILGSIESIHPGWFFLDDVVTQALRGNVEQIAKVSQRISAIAAAMPPDANMVCANTPWDESDPLMTRAKDGWFGRIIEQWATEGGRVLEKINGSMVEVGQAFSRRGEANLHTASYFEGQRVKINDDSIFYPQFEGKFFKSPTVLFDWNTMRIYEEDPLALAKASPYIAIIVDGAGGGKGADFCAIRVITWTAADAFANLDLIRERIGQTFALQLLLGRDETDASSEWIPATYPRYGKMGIVEYWMAVDPQLVVWFDDNTAAGWAAAFAEHKRLRRIRFGGDGPLVRKWPEVHMNRREGASTKEWLIRGLERWYAQGRIAYPKLVSEGGKGFGHGSRFGLTGSSDERDTGDQFRSDEFSRMDLGKLPPFDDMLDTERVATMEKVMSLMRRPAVGGGYTFGEKTFPAPTIDNPWGMPRTWFKQHREEQKGSWLSW